MKQALEEGQALKEEKQPAASRPLILVTNDDGIEAPGIRHLVRLMSRLGEVWVVAPQKGRSGMGHAITINNILTYRECPPRDGAVREFACSGTPADCVKLAKNELLERLPDLCVSGINHGSNAAINVIYSGTMAAALEGGIEGIPSAGFSLCDHDPSMDLSPLDETIQHLCTRMLEQGLPAETVLNVNFPTGPIKGAKLCRQAKTRWAQEFERRAFPRGEDSYFWMVGQPVCMDTGEDSDEWALAHGYASIVPITFDLTAYRAMDSLRDWEL